MQWRWLSASVVMACQASPAPTPGHLVTLAITDEAPLVSVLDDHSRLWGVFSTAPWIRFFDGAGWAGNGAWGTGFGQAVGADVTGDIVIGEYGQIRRLQYEPTTIDPIGPRGPTYVMSVATLSDGTLAVFWGLSLQWWRDGMSAWADTGLQSNHQPWITPTHELVDAMSNGDLVRITDPSAPEILATGLDLMDRPAGIDPAGDVVLYDNDSHIFAVSQGVVTQVPVDPHDRLTRLIATSKGVIAAVSRTTNGSSTELLLTRGDDGSWTPIVTDADTPTLTSDVIFRATPAGEIYVIDGGFVGRIDL